MNAVWKIASSLPVSASAWPGGLKLAVVFCVEPCASNEKLPESGCTSMTANCTAPDPVIVMLRDVVPPFEDSTQAQLNTSLVPPTEFRHVLPPVVEGTTHVSPWPSLTEDKNAPLMSAATK